MGNVYLGLPALAYCLSHLTHQCRDMLFPVSVLSKGWARVLFHRSLSVAPACVEALRVRRLSGRAVTWREAHPPPQASFSGQLSLCGESSGVCSKSEFVYRPLHCPYLPLSSTKDPGDMGTEGCSAGLVISAILCAHSTLNVNPKGWSSHFHCTD